MDYCIGRENSFYIINALLHKIVSLLQNMHLINDQVSNPLSCFNH